VIPGGRGPASMNCLQVGPRRRLALHQTEAQENLGSYPRINDTSYVLLT
jgi:hypothetical protein